MNTNELSKGIGRFFREPKDWKKPTNMEMDELLSIALHHPKVAEKEICERFNYWYSEYCKVRTGMILMTSSLSSLLVFCCTEWHNTTMMCASILLGAIATTGLHLIRKRARAINDRLRGCYYWIMSEILYPDTNPHESYPKIEEALLRRWDELDNHEQKAERKFRRLVKSFGYTPETIQQ
jgi:hypothetical protein